jgi:hypothetical protein
MVEKGRCRASYGAAQGHARLTDARVVEAKQRIAAGESQLDIARDFGVHPTTISYAVRGKTWRHLLIVAAVLVLSSALPAHATNWSIGYTVTTTHRTNVVVRWTLTCSNGEVTRTQHKRIHTQTPIHHELPPTLVDATSCHIHVVAWDIPPHTQPHDWPAPVVTTWVNT